MPVDRRKVVLFAGAAALRLFLFITFPTLPDLLTGRVEISTPVTSFKRLLEGLYLYTHNVSPYNGGVFHQAPLLLPLFSILPDASSYPLIVALLYTAADLAAAEALVQIAETGESGASRLFTSPRKDQRLDPMAVGGGYLFNPFIILTCLARSTSSFTNLFIILATSKAAAGAVPTCIFALAIASYLSLHPVLLLPPIAILCYDRVNIRYTRSSQRAPDSLTFTGGFLGGFALASAFLLYSSRLVTGSWSFLASTYGVRLLLSDLTPNVGLWWYWFIEMFDSFREFFLGVFWLHMASYVGGLTIRLRRQPLFVITALLGIFAIFQPYPSIADSGLFLSFLPLYRHVFGLMRYSFFAAAVLLYVSFLGPAFYHLWIYAGSGNANFFYAITLVWSIGLTLIVADVLFAVLRDEWEVERPEMKGKDIRQI